MNHLRARWRHSMLTGTLISLTAND